MSKLLLSSFIILLICFIDNHSYCQQVEAGLAKDELGLKLLSMRTGDYGVIEMIFALNNNGNRYYLYNAYTAISKNSNGDVLLFERVLMAKITIKFKDGSLITNDVIERTNLDRSHPIVLTPCSPSGRRRVEIVGVATSSTDIQDCIVANESKHNLSDIAGIYVGIPIYEYNSPGLTTIHAYIESSLIDFKIKNE
ncbi:MAG TPA: hypothetical protein VFB27_06140 [Opitutaceae bacterium]|nr:hypothetical protein [Opitutaceae bacterium]